MPKGEVFIWDVKCNALAATLTVRLSDTTSPGLLVKGSTGPQGSDFGVTLRWRLLSPTTMEVDIDDPGGNYSPFHIAELNGDLDCRVDAVMVRVPTSPGGPPLDDLKDLDDYIANAAKWTDEMKRGARRLIFGYLRARVHEKESGGTEWSPVAKKRAGALRAIGIPPELFGQQGKQPPPALARA